MIVNHVAWFAGDEINKDVFGGEVVMWFAVNLQVFPSDRVDPCAAEAGGYPLHDIEAQANLLNSSSINEEDIISKPSPT